MSTLALPGFLQSFLTRWHFKVTLPAKRRATLHGITLDISGLSPLMKNHILEDRYEFQERRLVQRCLTAHSGRIVDTAGDGVFLCFPDITLAVQAMVQLQHDVAHDNDGRPPEHRLHIRVGCHHGPVLTDGTLVSGDSVNVCARVSSTAQSGEVRLTQAAYAELVDVPLRMRCRHVASVELKGIDKPVPLFSLDWHDPKIFPTLVRFEDGSETQLPTQDVIRFGRLKDHNGLLANDIVLTMRDPEALNRISRWHFELHLTSSGYLLKSVSAAVTRVGEPLRQLGDSAAARCASPPNGMDRVAPTLSAVGLSGAFSERTPTSRRGAPLPCACRLPSAIRTRSTAACAVSTGG